VFGVSHRHQYSVRRLLTILRISILNFVSCPPLNCKSAEFFLGIFPCHSSRWRSVSGLQGYTVGFLCCVFIFRFMWLWVLVHIFRHIIHSVVFLVRLLCLVSVQSRLWFCTLKLGLLMFNDWCFVTHSYTNRDVQIRHEYS